MYLYVLCKALESIVVQRYISQWIIIIIIIIIIIMPWIFHFFWQNWMHLQLNAVIILTEGISQYDDYFWKLHYNKKCKSIRFTICIPRKDAVNKYHDYLRLNFFFDDGVYIMEFVLKS